MKMRDPVRKLSNNIGDVMKVIELERLFITGGKMGSNTRNISWDIEEAVLLMDLFIKIQSSTDKKYIDSKIIGLSKILNYRAKILHLKVTGTFRNPNGIRMKLQNLNYLMSTGQKGYLLCRQWTKEYTHFITKIEMNMIKYY